MSEQDYLAKTKEDLVSLVRISGVMPISKARRMRKAELAHFLAEMDKREGDRPTDETSDQGGQGRASKRSPSKRRGNGNAPANRSRKADDADSPKGDKEAKDGKGSSAADEARQTKVRVKDHRRKDQDEEPRTEVKSHEARPRPAGGRSRKNNNKQQNAKSRQDDRGDVRTSRKDRKDRDDKNDKNDKNDRNDRSDRSDRNDRNDRKDRSDQRSNKNDNRGKRGNHNGRGQKQDQVTGVLEVMPDGYGFLRLENYIQNPQDAYVPPQLIRRFHLRNGDLVDAQVKDQKDQDRYRAVTFIEQVNGLPPDKMIGRPHFERLTPIYPLERFTLETVKNEFSTRVIDLVAPIGKGQRGMIVSPPKAGKTILLQKIANALAINNPEAKLIVLLIDERPEEVTDMQRLIKGEVVYSTFDKTPDNHVRITELVLDRAKRMVELGEDVVVLLDSMTRMARAYNSTINPTGRTLSGGLDPGALYGPKKFFGAARNIENGGSLTIVATSLVETGSRMDEVIFEEFKGTGNMEVVLDRKLSEKRIFPAIDINRSGTRREELLMTRKELDAVWKMRKAFGHMDSVNVTEMVLGLLKKTPDNARFIATLSQTLSDKQGSGDYAKPPTTSFRNA